MAGVAFAANTVVVYGDDVFAGDPLATQLAAECIPYIGTFAVRTGIKPFVWRVTEAMGLEQIDCLFKHFTTVGADQHASSPSLTRMYSPQWHSRFSLKSLHGHLFSGFFSYLHGQ